MALLNLTDDEKSHLRTLAHRSKDRRVIHRALGLLDLDAGHAATTVAARLGVGRATVYDWAARFRAERQSTPSLVDKPRTGRPSTSRSVASELAEKALKGSPHAEGYRHTTWTVGLLAAHLKKSSGQEISDSTFRRALHGLGYRWKRPRFTLSRRSPTWRQAKGG